MKPTVLVTTRILRNGIKLHIASDLLNTSLSFEYPSKIWESYPPIAKEKLVNSIAHVFTAHLPYLLNQAINLKYSTGYPASFSWSMHVFSRYLPGYKKLYHNDTRKKIIPMLRLLLNSQSTFKRQGSDTMDYPLSDVNSVVIPFTFGKDSFLSYWLARDLDLKPILVCFNDPLGEDYEGFHKQKLLLQFKHYTDSPTYFLDNPLSALREKGEGTFGWELVMSSWALLSLPICHFHSARHIVFSNERAVNDPIKLEAEIDVLPDFEQSEQATNEISILTQTLTGGNVFTTSWLQGLEDLAIVGILKRINRQTTFSHLMSCWAERNESETKRWCGMCPKCGRLFLYMIANNINPNKESGFEDNMLTLDKKHLFNVFGSTVKGTTWDAFGLNKEEQSLAFYLAYLRGNTSPLVLLFTKTDSFQIIGRRYKGLITKYYSLHQENITSNQWHQKINIILNTHLKNLRKSLFTLGDL